MNARRKCYIAGAMFGPFSFINVVSSKEDLNVENGLMNTVEVAVTFRIMQMLFKKCALLNHEISIAILSTHPAQVKCMQQNLEKYQQHNEFCKVRVGFVDDYQPGEADVVIISTVGADKGECCYRNVDNVYLDWARHCLWILGDEEILMKGESVWKSSILKAKAQGCFFQANESKDLAKAILEVKKDLNQLDELLSGKSTLFQNTTWKVLFSSMFRTSFTKIKSLETKKLVLLMLLKLSSGWRPKGTTSTAASISKSHYCEHIKEYKVKGLHLICTIDIIKETHYTQVLKVWDILPFHEIEGLVKRLEGIIGMYTQEYIHHCKEKCVQRGSEYREFPMKWLATSEIIQYKTHANHCNEMFMDGVIENVKVRESLILMKFYSLSTGGVNTIINGCDGGDIGIPFELTEQEKCVVSFDKSSFILGRSGTGKTTVLTMKLLQNQQLHHLACEGFHEVTENKEEAKHDVLHQLFVTFSSKLCYAIRQQFGEWKRSTCGGGSSSQSSLACIDDIDQMMLTEDIPDQFINLRHDVYPLIITFHRFLLMLDGTVGTSYFERFSNVRRLINGSKTSTTRFSVLEQFMRLKEVTYVRFCSAYWHHLNNKLTKNLDPSAVYTEIMSVIKGGLVTDKAPNGILPRDDYVSLCDGRVSIFDSQKREIIYSIYLQYENIKVENGNFDLADLVNDLHKRVEEEGYTGELMDYVYVDEVQDLSMSQIMLFKYVCTNVQEGFAFSGDTAQAIAKGIGFRFEDIRCLFFKKFLSGFEKGNISKMFQLSENFRTHAGVLNLAQSVIDLLCHFFPLFVDALRPETSRISGDLPILLESGINNNAIEFIFERIGDCSHLINGFGAEQVVLVRDESMKEKVLDIVGKNALVLTIMESKGLEFQDVFLYDFFATSSFSNEWRIIYNYMKDINLLDSPFMTTFPSFNMQKHAVLCGELKQLYVAITRARQRLWICESTGFSDPIFDYWKKLSLVEVKHLSDSFAKEMQIPSSKDEWRSRGVKLFRENNFRMAQMCFLKAGDEYSEKLSEAYYLRAISGNARASRLEREKLLKNAAELFSSIGKKVMAAECFYEIEDYRAAGYIYKSESMAEKAGNCFHLARCYKLAVEEYEKVGAFAKCLSSCTDGNLFDYGFEQLGHWVVCRDAEKKFLHKGAHYSFSIKDFDRMMKFVRSFHDKAEMRTFLTSSNRNCFEELIVLEKEWRNFKEVEKLRHKGAHYSFSIKDFDRMMKFVRSFYDKAEMRTFLINRNCFEELILLEQEWRNFEEVAKLRHKGAHYSFSNKDFDRMMKFVRSFNEKDEMRTFLIKRNCFEELILLEQEWRNFEEVAKLRHKGAHYSFSIKDFDRMMKFVRSFNKKDEMRCFLAERNRYFELIFLEKEWGDFKEAAKVTHKGAHYYLSIMDSDSMMKLVRTFNEKDEMRSFLTENKCLDELISLEKEWGNFEAAAKVARMKPDPILEADLLQMGGLHRESALVILWHVFLNSQIFREKNKPFKPKKGLITKALTVAKKTDSDAFCEFVCQVAEILSHGETKEELLEKGLEFIYCNKENALDVNLEWVKTAHEIKEIEKNVIDLLRSFLKSTNNLNKLLLLEEICGEFVEAANISNKDGHSIEAASSRLWYVFYGSLWACGTSAWPLKDFKHKSELLNDTYSYVLGHPDSDDSALVQAEIHVLSGKEISLSDMWRYFREIPRQKCLRLHFLISRRILDVHLGSQCEDCASIETQVEDETFKHVEGSLSENIVSVESLIYVWNYWKDMICELINWSLTNGQHCKTNKSYENFVYNYFGVRKYDVEKYGGYVVLDHEAQWVKQTHATITRNGYLYIIPAQQFSLAASSYWCSELASVAEKVCGKLESLHAYTTEKNLSIHQQSNILMRLLEVVKSLQKCKFPYSGQHASQIVDKYSQLCVDQLLQIMIDQFKKMKI